jgi:signal transduction histidine kinase
VPAGRLATAARRGAAWWTEPPGGPGAAPVPGRIETRYRAVAAAISAHATATDTVLAAALAACTLGQLVHLARNEPGQLGPALAFSVLLVIPLIWRRRFPLAEFGCIIAVALVQWVLNVKVAADITLLVYLYTIASRYRLRAGVLAAGAVETGALLAAIRWPLTGLSWIGTLILFSGPVMASLLLGVSVRHWRNSFSALTERARQLERERDQQARIAAAAERTRIAREMHDVIAHSLSVMVTLSKGAALKQAAEPERASLAMRQVAATGHQALDEMRRLLGVLRTEDAPESRQPQPGVAQIDALFDQVRSTGLAAELTVTGTPEALPPGAELTVYRIVQEALTNTLKHAAAPTGVSVAISYRPDVVTVDVRDDGARRDAGPEAATPGHGLTGMRERAAVYGGAVAAGPGPVGGWQIHARLPMASGTPQPAGRDR